MEWALAFRTLDKLFNKIENNPIKLKNAPF